MASSVSTEMGSFKPLMTSAKEEGHKILKSKSEDKHVSAAY